MKVIIVDDEPLARMRMRRLLGAAADVEVLADCSDGASLHAALTVGHVDAVFLDIQMPGADGFALWQTLPQPRPALVFVTAHADYALQAFGVEAVDYLLKPVDQARVMASLERLRRKLSALQRPESAFPARLALPIGRRTELVPADHIEHISAQANYLEISTGLRTFVLRKSISSMLQELDPAVFLRVHRSSIVRKAAVHSVQSAGSGRHILHMQSGVKVLSARNYRDALRAAFGLPIAQDLGVTVLAPGISE
jgi:two-component system, LytTR family, response regulator